MQSKQFNKAMGEVIRRARKIRGLSQSVVGEALGVSFQQIQKYELGANGLNAHYIPALAKLFSLGVAEMYELAGAIAKAPELEPADNDAFLVSRYVRKIRDGKLRQAIIDFTRKVGYEGARA